MCHFIGKSRINVYDCFWINLGKLFKLFLNGENEEEIFKNNWTKGN